MIERYLARRHPLRSTEADLRVIVQDEDGNREVFRHYSQILAFHSGYVDTLLSTCLGTHNDDLNESKEYTEIVIPDVTPFQWKQMMYFLENPYDMTVDAVFELVSFYDQYGFQGGLKICDGVLCEKALVLNFNTSNDWRHGLPLRLGLQQIVYIDSMLDKAVRAIVTSHSMGLKKTFYWGRAWLKFLFADILISRFSGFPLADHHIKKLEPVFERDAELTHYTDVIGDCDYLDDKRVTDYLRDEHREELGLGLRDGKRAFQEKLAEPKIQSLALANKIAKQVINFIKVSFPSSMVNRDGYYHYDFRYNPADHTDDTYGICYHHNAQISFSDQGFKFKKRNQWIFTYCGMTELVCRDSEFDLVPPKTGWVDGNGDKVQITIEYIWKLPALNYKDWVPGDPISPEDLVEDPIEL